MKRHELENKGVFSRMLLRSHKRLRILHTNIHTKISIELDTWQEFLKILMYWVFFAFILSLPAVYFGLLRGAIYAYAWWTMWAVIMIVLAIREDLRKEKAKSYKYKLIQRPKALKEYLEIVKPKD